jgi:hypothetical protein
LTFTLSKGKKAFANGDQVDVIQNSKPSSTIGPQMLLIKHILNNAGILFYGKYAKLPQAKLLSSSGTSQSMPRLRPKW